MDGDVQSIEKSLSDGQKIDSRDQYGQTAVMLASTYGHKAIVELLIAHQADLDVTAKYGLSALMLAIINHHTDIAASLTEAGANTNFRGTGAPGFAGKTARDLAKDNGFTELVEILTRRAVSPSSGSRP